MRDRPGWQAELHRLISVLAELPAAFTLDIACGTGYLTRHLRGRVVATDLSTEMLRIARERTGGPVLAADGLNLPFRRRVFDRAFTGHFYGHLPPAERTAFLAEVNRVASCLLVVDSAPRPDTPAECWQERKLSDGSRHAVFKRYLTGAALADEIGGRPLFSGSWFAAAATGPGR